MVQTEIIQKRAKYTKSLERALESLVKQFTSIPEIEKVFLFGSYAQGRRDLFTDMDLLVIMNTHLGFLQRTAELYRRIEIDVDLDMLVYTPQEFDRNQDNAFIRQVSKTGQVIYEKRCA